MERGYFTGHHVGRSNPNCPITPSIRHQSSYTGQEVTLSNGVFLLLWEQRVDGILRSCTAAIRLRGGEVIDASPLASSLKGAKVPAVMTWIRSRSGRVARYRPQTEDVA